MTDTNKTASKTAAAVNASATRVMEDSVRNWSQAMNGWLDAQHRLMTAAMSAMPTMPAAEQMTGMGMTPEVRESVEQMGCRMRSGANRVVHGTVDVATTNLNEMATMMSEQSRFMGRLADRVADCMLGEHAARTPEAFAATTRAMMTDCVENAAVVSERMIGVGARSMDSVRTMVEGEIATATAATR